MSARKSVVWSFGSNVAFFVIQFGASIALARLLTPTEMGIYALALSILLIITALQNLGLPSYIVRATTLEPKRLGTVYTMAGLQALGLAALIWFFAPVAAEMSDEPRVTSALRVLCLLALLSPVASTMGALLQRRMRFDLISIISTVRLVVSTAVTLYGAFNGWSYNSMSWGSIVGAAVAAIMTIWYVRNDLKFEISLTYWRDVWHFGSRSLVTLIAQNAHTRIPDFLLSAIIGVTATGLYNRATGMIDMFTSSVLAGFQRITQSLFVQYRDQSGSLKYVFLRTNRLILGLFWPLFAGLGVLAGPTINILFGPHWNNAAPVLSILAIAAMVNVACIGRTELFVTTGHFDVAPRIEVIRAIVSVGLFAAGAYFGLLPAAITRILAAGLAFWLYMKPVREVAGITGRELFRSLGRNAVVTMAAITPAFASMLYYSWPSELPLPVFAGCILAGIALWLLALRLLRHELHGEIARVLIAAFSRFRAPRAEAL